MLSENVLNLLKEWSECGWLRPLDRAFAGFLKACRPDSPDLVLLAAALVSHQLGRGHVCLDLEAVLAEPDNTLSLPPEGEIGEPVSSKPSEILDGVSLETWTQTLQSSALVAPGAGNTPLVFDDGRLYLRRYWQYTRQVAQQILLRLAHDIPVPDTLAAGLDRLFTPLRNPREQAKKEVHWQSVAAAVAAKSAFSVISGGPGTGKTTTVVHLLGLLQSLALDQGEKLRIRLAAPTGKAAARLTESIGDAVGALPARLQGAVPTEVTTLHRLLGSRPDTRHFVYNAQHLLHVDLLVVDEASMIDLEMMAALLDALPATARLILMGDKDQLASVEAGSVLGDLCRHLDPSGYLPQTAAWIKKHTGFSLKAFTGSGTRLDQHIVVLRKSHRFGENSGIGALARAVNAGDPWQVAAVWNQGFSDIAQVVLQDIDDQRFSQLVLDGHSDHVTRAQTSGTPMMGYRAYLERITADAQVGLPENEWLNAVLADFNRFQLLSPIRRGTRGVERLNEKAAEMLFRAGLIRATEGWYAGRPVMVTRNDYSLGLMNGDMGIVLPVSDDQGTDQKILKVVFPMPDGTLKKVLPSRLTDVETVYAMTVHKSQGSEFDHTVLVFPDSMSPVLTRELFYTAITRSRSRFTLVTPRMDLPVISVQRCVHRASGLGDLFNY